MTKPRIVKIKIYSNNISYEDAFFHMIMLSREELFQKIDKKEHKDCAYAFKNGNGAFVRRNKTEIVVKFWKERDKADD